MIVPTKRLCGVQCHDMVTLGLLADPLWQSEPKTTIQWEISITHNIQGVLSSARETPAARRADSAGRSRSIALYNSGELLPKGHRLAMEVPTINARAAFDLPGQLVAADQRRHTGCSLLRSSGRNGSWRACQSSGFVARKLPPDVAAPCGRHLVSIKGRGSAICSRSAKNGYQPVRSGADGAGLDGGTPPGRKQHLQTAGDTPAIQAESSLVCPWSIGFETVNAVRDAGQQLIATDGPKRSGAGCDAQQCSCVVASRQKFVFEIPLSQKIVLAQSSNLPKDCCLL